jgi:hypothetical protein
MVGRDVYQVDGRVRNDLVSVIRIIVETVLFVEGGGMLDVDVRCTADHTAILPFKVVSNVAEREIATANQANMPSILTARLNLGQAVVLLLHIPLALDLDQRLARAIKADVARLSSV